MSLNIAFSLMANFEKWGNKKGYLEKGIVSSVVPTYRFGGLVDLVESLANPERDHEFREAYGFVPTTFLANDTDPSKPRYARNGENEIDESTFFYVDIDNPKPSTKATLEKVIPKLVNAGITFVGYTTRKHSDENHRFRILFPIDAPLSRFDARKIGIYLNKEWFSGQADLSVYNSAQFLYLPNPGATVFKNLSGTPLDVRSLLTKAATLLGKEPHLAVGCSKLSEKKQQADVAKALTNCLLLESVKDMSVRPEINIANRNVFSPRWLELYQGAVSHWGAMRTILGSVWKLTEGTLTYGEMQQIFDEVDATGGGYFARVHGAKKTDQLIKFFFTRPATGANDNWKSFLSAEDIGLTIHTVANEPGQGKTYNAIGDVAASRESTVIAVPKISDIDTIKQQIEQRFWVKPEIYVIHGEYGRDGVQSQLTQLRKNFNRRKNKAQKIVLITHAALMMHTWRNWSDFNCLIDESPETFFCYTVNIKNNPDVLTKHVEVLKAIDGKCQKVRMRGDGKSALKDGDFDDIEKTNQELLEYLSTKNSTMWIETDQWNNRDKQAITFFGMVSPEKLLGFKSVQMLGDEVTKSITLRMWAAKWGVKVNVIEAPVRPRAMPIGDRLTIRYFAEQGDASITLFDERQPELPSDICLAIAAEHPGHDILWTANERFRRKIKFDGGTFVTPRTHGRNDLQHHTVMVWLAAMKPSTAAAAAIYGICGMSYDEVVEWREYNPMFQFVMRGSLRKLDGTEPVIVYVYSRKQADYLQRRMGGTLEYFGDKLGDQAPAPKAAAPLSDAQRTQIKQWSSKMVDNGWERWTDSKDTVWKHKVEPALIPLIERAAAEKRAKKKLSPR